MKRIGIIGTGGFAREVLCLLDDLDKYNEVVGFFEPDRLWDKEWMGKTIMGLPVLPYSSIKESYNLSIAIGSSEIRKRIVQDLGSKVNYETFVHPSAVISRWSCLGKGNIITAGCILTSQIELGDQCQLNLQTTVGHDCQIESYFTSAPSVNLSGNCIIGESVYFGTGAATRQSIKICSNVIIGMGAMVVKNISESGTYIGIPARRI